MLTLQQQIDTFDFPVTDLDALLVGKDSGQKQMMAMSMLSDVQDMITSSALSKETIRRAINRAKYIIDHII